mgnify:FL=1|tara:strand:+ start:2247 stop:3428 length:1182 start_codon:yes stop_codon:yes gene_type:complete
MRYSDFKIVENVEHLYEADARIQHAEDLIFFQGSKGAIRTLEALKSMEQGGQENVTVKWDGSPAIIFGRNENGEFILTDKSGFTAKGYDGRAKSAEALQKMLMARPGARNPDPKKAEGYARLASNMKDIFDEYEKAVPKDFSGYLKGDLLYFNTPEVIDNKFVFTPNIVTYRVDVNSDLGKQIAQSKTGIVVHRLMDENGQEGPVPNNMQFIGTEVLLFPSVTVQQPAEIEDEDINALKASVSKFGASIDKMLDKPTLMQLKMKDLPDIFYTYMNSKVDTGLTKLGQDFLEWMKTSKISGVKQTRIIDHISQNQQAFNAMWDIVTGILIVKDKIIKQFDSHDSTVKADIGPHGPVTPDAHGDGGEGYVLAHPEGDIKLVPRAYFTKANRSVQR